MAKQQESLNPKPKKKPPKGKIILVIILIVIISGLFLFTNHIYTNQTVQNTTNTLTKDSTNILTPVAEFLHLKKDANHPNTSIINIGSAPEGYVTLEGPYGNTSSDVTVAYVIGQHPRESDSHQALENAVKNESGNCHYEYYIYKIHVTKDSTDFTASRMNGQLLAQQFVVPNIVAKHFSLVCDIHTSNAFYFPDPYIFTPGSTNGTSKELSQEIAKNNSEWLYYYEPPEYSSPKYCTLPILENGTPAMVFEAHGQPGLSLQQQLNDLVSTIDNLKL